MNRYCRLCGEEKKKLLNIFHKDGAETTETAVQIQKIFSIDVRKDDRLPITICNACGNLLTRTATFIERTHRAQKRLDQLCKILDWTRPDDEPSPSTSQNPANNLLYDESNLNKIDTVSDNYNKNQLHSQNGMNSENDELFVSNLEELETNDFETELPFDANNTPDTYTSKLANAKSSRDSVVKVDRKSVNEPSKSILQSILQSESNNRNGVEDSCMTPVNDSISDNDANDISDDSCTEQSSPRDAETNELYRKMIEKTRTSRRLPIRKTQNAYYCELCKVHFGRHEDYEVHTLIHTNGRSFDCKLCDNLYLRSEDLKAHMKDKHKAKDIKCSLCDFVCNRKGILARHVNTVHKDWVACSKCDFRTSTQRALSSHVRNRHTLLDPDFVCEICGNTFKTQVALNTHRNYKHFPVPKQCPRCGIICAHGLAYSFHKLNCVDHRRYYCDPCGASFFTKYRLKEHMNTHLNIRPYECSVCKKNFFQRYRLDQHMNVHRGPRFQCDVCGRGFNRKDNMKSHRKAQHPTQLVQSEANSSAVPIGHSLFEQV